MTNATAIRVLPGTAQGRVVSLTEGLSFWGGVDPDTARIIDAHHPQHGANFAGAILLMPTTRGSCSGSGVILDLALTGKAPAALIFSEAEDVATLGALIAAEMFDRPLPVLRVSPAMLAALGSHDHLTLGNDSILGDGLEVPVISPAPTALDLTDADRAILDGRDGPAAALCMRIVCTVALQQGAARLTDISRGHIDGCIYAHPANLTFAERMDELGAQVRVPTTINAISVDRENWRAQGVPPIFGNPAARLADAYVRMGCRPTFTCAPYLLNDRPAAGEAIAWAESNAVVYANSVLGARSPKHPDFLDLCMAVVGRAPLAGVYLDAERRAQRVLDIEVPDGADDALWPLLGYLAGLRSPDRIPLLRGLAGLAPSDDNLKALCAAFGTTSAAPMLHVAGVTPEAEGAEDPHADHQRISRKDIAAAWTELNNGPGEVDLIAIGSPHASLQECRDLAAQLAGKAVRVPLIVTTARQVIAQAQSDGTLAMLQSAGVQVLPDLCWCSITEPVFPPAARTVMTNSGKYAHYGPGLSGRALRFGSLSDCVATALTAAAPADPPAWLD